MGDRRIIGRPNIANARRRARKLFKDAAVDSIPVSLPQIIRYLKTKHDLEVMRYPFGEHISGMLVMVEGKPTIGFNPDDPWVRRRFTIAHEIGHFLMSHGSCDLCSSTPEEREANQFAAELLMPSLFIRKDFKRQPDVQELARKYLVSMEALTYQLMDCRVL